MPPIPHIPLQSDQMQHLDPEPYRFRDERRLVGIHNRPLPDQIHLRWRHDLRAFEQLPPKVRDRRDDQHCVVREEGLDTRRAETGVPEEEHHEALTDQPDPGAVRLEFADVGELAAVDALDLAGLVEAQVGDAHDDVVDDAARGDQVDQPGEHLGGAVGELQEGEERKAHDDAETEEGDAVGGACGTDDVSFMDRRERRGQAAYIGAGLVERDPRGRDHTRSGWRNRCRYFRRRKLM